MKENRAEPLAIYQLPEQWREVAAALTERGRDGSRLFTCADVLAAALPAVRALEAERDALKAKVDADVLARMCDEFRAEVFRKAGKPDPALP